MNAITYKEVFPLIKDNRIWLGTTNRINFLIPPGSKGIYLNTIPDSNTELVKSINSCWFANLEHGRRHQPLKLMTMADNIKYRNKGTGISEI